MKHSNSDNSAKEQKILPFCFLPRAQARLRLLRLASCHRSTAQSLLHRCEMMSSAAKEAKCSGLVGMDVRRCLGSWWFNGGVCLLVNPLSHSIPNLFEAANWDHHGVFGPPTIGESRWGHSLNHLDCVFFL